MYFWYKVQCEGGYLCLISQCDYLLCVVFICPYLSEVVLILLVFLVCVALPINPRQEIAMPVSVSWFLVACMSCLHAVCTCLYVVLICNPDVCCAPKVVVGGIEMQKSTWEGGEVERAILSYFFAMRYPVLT